MNCLFPRLHTGFVEAVGGSEWRRQEEGEEDEVDQQLFPPGTVEQALQLVISLNASPQWPAFQQPDIRSEI
jgi:hypothetical protein